MKKVWYAPNGFEAYGEDEIKAVENCLRDGWLAGFGKYTIVCSPNEDFRWPNKIGNADFRIDSQWVVAQI